MWHKVEEESVKSRDTIAITVRVLVLVLVILAVLVASVGVAEAQGTPAQVIMWTDKKIYEAWRVDVSKTSLAIGSATTDVPNMRDTNLNITVYAMVLDDDGKILKGINGNLINGTIDDIERQDHFDKGVTTTHHSITTNPSYFYGTFHFNDTDGDGIYLAYADLPDVTLAQQNDFKDDHLLVNISVNYSSLSSYTNILLTGIRCHNLVDQTWSHNQHTVGASAPTAGGAPCTQCHTGYMHLYSNSSKYMQSSLLESRHSQVWKPLTIPASAMNSNTANGWNVNLSESTNDNKVAEAGWGGTDTDFVGAEYCFYCHYDAAQALDYGEGTGVASDRPSCGQASSNPLSGYSTNCHATTNITNTSLAGIDWFWLQNPVQNKTHSHPANAPNVSCGACHVEPHFGGLPNTSYKTYKNISEQCWLCHSGTGPKTSTKFAHSGSTTNCTLCHYSAANKLDAHLVPKGIVGGVNCTSCHNSTGGTATGSLVNFTSVNKSMHGNLNKNASSSPGNVSNKLCWACHGTKNGTYANESDQPLSSHNETVYQNPRKCYECHNDSVSQFTAKSITEHIPSGISANTDVNTSSYNNAYCSLCHNNSIGTSIDPDGSGLAGGSEINASVSHYGANKTANKLMSAANNSTDCVYCHRNSSNMLKWGILSWSLANISNKNTTGGGTDHTAYTSSSQCASCHGGYTVTTGFTFHNTALGSGSFGGRNCTSCHDVGKSNAMVDVSKMNQTSSIHNYLNSNATASIPDNKRCWGCHTNSSVSSDGRVDESELPAGEHPDAFDTPRNCTLCHIDNKFGALIVSEHFTSGSEIKTKYYSGINASCVACHNKTEMLLSNNDPGGVKSVYASVSHYGDNKTSNTTYVVSSNANCTYCHNNTNVFTSEMVNSLWNSSIRNHTGLGTNPNCTDANCHSTGRIHVSTLTKPQVSSTLCLSCHDTKVKHNGTVECVSCHLENNKSIHPVQYLQPDSTWKINSVSNKSSAVKCTDCHQTGVSGFDAPLIPDTLKHSSNLSNGTIWGTFWTSGLSSCNYCHGNTTHNYSSALGRIYNLTADTNNTRNGTITTTTWCVDCHYNTSNANYKGDLWVPVPPLITVNNTLNGRWEDHSTYLGSGIKDTNCEGCHAQNITAPATSLNYSHSLDEGVAGGPNCISCHNLATGLGGGAPAGINFTSFNQSTHFGMNSVNSSSNGACWACHDTDGNVTSGHGDRQKTPKICTECHIGTTGAFNNSAYNAIFVWEHYNSGEEIIAGNSSSNIASCINCHENISEMILYNNDTDTGSFTGDGLREKGGNMSFYHYGKSRTDMRVGAGLKESNCLYCHQNTSTAFQNAMQNPAVSKYIYNHTDNPAQKCTTCHVANQWIHNKSLTIPNSGIVDNGYCSSCHVTGIGGTRAIPDTHNSLGVNCWACHQDPNTSVNPMYNTPIHGMMYALSNGSYRRHSDNNTPANCTTCHVYSLVNNSPNTAVRVPELNHSTDMYAGKKWGNYWDNNSLITACYFCHQSEPHNQNTVLLGNISNIQGGNQYKSSNLATSRWCSACHYNDITSNYKGLILSPVPPEILNRTGTVPQNANDSTMFYNHSNDVTVNSNDSKCMECHALAGSFSETTLNYSHSLNEGGGGPDCVSSGCHGTTGSGTSPYMNWTSLETGIHAGLNSGAANTTTLTDTIDKACWACHGDGTQPGGHPSNYKQPYNCTACHLASGIITGKYQAKNVTEHQHVDARILTNSSYARCENCHNNSLVSYSDNETSPTTILTNYTSGNVSHYGASKTAGKLMYNSSGNSEDCVWCHLNNSNRQKWSNATNATATKPDIHGSFNASTPGSKCWECHVDGGVSGVTSGFTLHNSSLNPGASESCLACHVEGGSAQRVNVSSGDLGMHVDLNQSEGAGILNNSDCWVCHFGYPQPGTSGSHSYNVNRKNTYYCEDCHGPVKNATAIPNATTKILTNFYHGKSYFDSAPKYKDCTICHAANDSRNDSNGNRLKIYHNQTPLGTVANTGWAGWSVGMIPGCNDCHQTRNINEAPFHAPGKDHYVSASGGCTKNCHKGDLNSNVHRQYLFGDIAKVYGITPPVILSVTINSPVSPGVDVNITVHGQDNGNQIEAARYLVINSSGATVVGWSYMIPQDNKFKSRSEIAKGSINTTSLSSGNYTVYIQIMASGPRTDQTKRAYPYNGAWSGGYSTGFTVIG